MFTVIEYSLKNILWIVPRESNMANPPRTTAIVMDLWCAEFKKYLVTVIPQISAECTSLLTDCNNECFLALVYHRK